MEGWGKDEYCANCTLIWSIEEQHTSITEGNDIVERSELTKDIHKNGPNLSTREKKGTQSD